MELWLILAILTGIFFGVQSILLKVLTKSFDQTIILKNLFLIAGILLFPAIFFSQPQLEWRPFLGTFFVSLVLNTIAYHFLLQAITNYPVSIVMPYVGLTPLFLTLTSYLILGETLTRVQILGIGLIVFGAFILQLPPNWQFKDWRRWINWREKGIWLMVLVAFIWSITASVEKIAVKASSPEFYGAAIHLALGGIFVIIERWPLKQASKSLAVKNHNSKPKHKQFIILLGLISAALAWCQLFAIKITYVSYVIAFKRAGVLVSVLLAFLILKERNYIKALTGTILIIIGAALITL